MTEDEAKMKWCPFVRLWSEQGAAANRDPYCGHSATDKSNCIGSACMAWRVRFVRKIGPQGARYDAPDGGYCGLAGAPQ